jgi:ABC-2 type transport system permease protein
MKNVMIIFKREFSSYFNSPIAYIFIVAILAVCSGLYSFFFFFAAGVAEMRDFFSINSWLMLFFLPAITMRLWAEEQNTGSIALLQSLPIRSIHLVLGKFFAGIGFYVLYLLGTLPILIAIVILGNPDGGPIFGGYLGLLLLGALYTSMGLFFSGLFKDQITAWVMAVIGAMVFHLLGWLPIAAQLDSWIGGLGTFLQRSVGSLGHFETMYKGVISVNDIVYFLSYIAVFLILNALTVEQRMRRQADLTFTGVAVVMVAVAAMFNLVVYQLPLGRWDATEGKIYTISDSAKNIIEDLKTTVTVRYYVTPEDKMPPGMKDIERNITDKLEEFRNISDKVKFEVIDPTANEELAQSLTEKGISPFTLRTTERDAVGIKKVYSSISISYLDKPNEVIPQVMPQSLPNLEYDICSIIFKMTQESPPTVAIVAPYEPMDPRYNDPRMRQFMQQMGQQIPEKNDRYMNLTDTYRQLGYNISRVDLSSQEPLPDNVKAIVLLEPKSLTDRQKYEIAKELYAGKDVIIAAQEYRYNYNPGQGGNIMIMPTQLQPGINGLISNYGLSLGDKIMMDEINQVVGIQAQQSMGFLTMPVNLDVQSPIQIKVSPEYINQNLAFTANLGPMIYLWGSPIIVDSTKIDELGLDLKVLMTSSPETWEVDYSGTPLAGDAVNPDYQDMVGRQPLAVILQGQFPDPYENQPTPKWQDLPDSVETPAEVEEVTPAPGRLLLIGNNEIFTDQFIPDASYRGQKPSHEDLLLKAVEGFALSEDLLHIRSKIIPVRYLEETSPLAKVLWRAFIILLAPAIIIAFGVFRMLARRERRAAYRRLLEQAHGGVR